MLGEHELVGQATEEALRPRHPGAQIPSPLHNLGRLASWDASAVPCASEEYRPPSDEAAVTVPFFTYLAEWVTQLDRPSVTADFTHGPDNRPKRAAWAMVEGPAAAGQLTVWESGEVEVEAFDPATSEPVLAESLVVHAEHELDVLLSWLLSTCAGP